MRRREFITLVGGAVAASPFTVRAQADGIKRLTILMSVADDPEGQARVAAFRQGLQQLGWAEGRNVRIEYRWGNADADRLKTYAAEAVTAAPDVILVGGTTALIPTHKATRSIPIVFVGSADPVGQGFVERLPRPGGNMTSWASCWRRSRRSRPVSRGSRSSIARPMPTLPTIGVRSRRWRRGST